MNYFNIMAYNENNNYKISILSAIAFLMTFIVHLEALSCTYNSANSNSTIDSPSPLICSRLSIQGAQGLIFNTVVDLYGAEGRSGQDGAAAPVGSGRNGDHGKGGEPGAESIYAMNSSVTFNTAVNLEGQGGVGGVGGSGGAGGSGYNGASGTNFPGGFGGRGGNGGPGGRGSSGVRTDGNSTVVFKNNYINIGASGGQGGAGGRGGSGGNGGSNGGSGGNGGEGSVGGSGGEGSRVIEVGNANIIFKSAVDITGGQGGNGGVGGNGGTGGFGNNAGAGGTGGSGGNGGNGGSGGKGGDGIYFSGNGKVILDSAVNKTTGGTGGRGSVGGSGGIGRGPGGINGSNGTGGNGGSGGYGINITSGFGEIEGKITATGGIGGIGSAGKADGKGGYGISVRNATLVINNDIIAISGEGGDGTISGIAGTKGEYAVWVENGTIIFKSNVDTSGGIAGVNLISSIAKFELGDSDRTLKGGMRSQVNNFSSEQSKLIINTSYDGNNGSLKKLNLAAGSFDFNNNIDSLTINVTDSAMTNIPKVGGGEAYTFLVAGIDAILIPIDSSKLIVSSEGSDIVGWVSDTGKIVRTIRPEFKDGIVIDVPLEAVEDGKGKLKFLGSATVSKMLGNSGARLNEIRFSAGDTSKVIELRDNIFSNNIVIEGGTIKLAGDIKGTGTTLDFNDSTAIFEINGVTNQVIEGMFTKSGNSDMNINFDLMLRSDLTLTADISSLEFKTINLGTGGTLLAKVGVSSPSAVAMNTINFNSEDSKLSIENTSNRETTFNLSNRIGAAGDRQGTLSILANSKTNINKQSPSTSIGTDSTHMLKELQLSGTGEVRIEPAVYSHLLTVNNTSSTSFDNEVNIGQLIINPSSATTFKGNTVIMENIVADVEVDERGPKLSEAGVLTFNNTASVKNIGMEATKIKMVTFNDKTSFDGDVYVSTLTTEKGMKVLRDMKIVTGQHTWNLQDNNELGTNTATFSGAGKATGVTMFTTSYDATTNKGGNIVVTGAGSILDLSKAPSVNVTFVGATSKLPDVGKKYEYKVLSQREGGGIIAPSVTSFTSEEQNKIIKWKYTPATYTLWTELKPEVLIDDVVNSGGSGAVVDIVKVIADPNVTGPAREVLGYLGLMTTGQLIETLGRLQPLTETVEIISTVMDEALDSLDSRISQQVRPNLFAGGGTEGIGVAAGDANDKRYGIWFSPVYGKSKQGARGSAPSYKSSSYGGTIGFDRVINEGTMVGIAFTPLKTTTKYSNAKLSDKGQMESMILSLYGYKELSDRWFAEGIICGGSNKVSSQEKRIITTTVSQVASSKYSTQSYSGQLTIGYNYRLSEKVMLTPVIGHGYYWVGKADYNETGASIQNLKVKKSTGYIAEGYIGSHLALETIINGASVTPELYGYVNYDYDRKSSKIEARLEGLNSPLPVRAPKDNKLSFNVGGEVNAKSKSGKYEYGFGYDAEIGKKYIGHIGTLKVRVNL